MPPKTIDWLNDNDICYKIAKARSFAYKLGFKHVTTPARSPKSNCMSNGFVKKLKRTYHKLVICPDSKPVMAELKDWFDDCN
jgi:putative transposase